MKNTTLQQSYVGKYLKFKVKPLTVTKKKFFTLWDVKFLVTLYVGKAKTKLRLRFNN